MGFEVRAPHATHLPAVEPTLRVMERQEADVRTGKDQHGLRLDVIDRRRRIPCPQEPQIPLLQEGTRDDAALRDQ